MDSGPMFYSTGEEVHAGDRVTYRGTYGTIVFVSNGAEEEYLPGYEDYIGSDRGVTFCDDDGEVSSLGEPDEMLAFLDRS